MLALGRTGGEEAIEALVGVLDDSDDVLRATAIKALEEAAGASPSEHPGDGRSTTPGEILAWKQWWTTHQRARGAGTEDVEGGEGGEEG